jgi:hypothetical protein
MSNTTMNFHRATECRIQTDHGETYTIIRLNAKDEDGGNLELTLFIADNHDAACPEMSLIKPVVVKGVAA